MPATLETIVPLPLPPGKIAVGRAGSVFVTFDRSHVPQIGSTQPSRITQIYMVVGRNLLPADSCPFVQPYGIAATATGTLVASDFFAHVIRQISDSGVVVSIGSAKGGYSDGPASTALFDRPMGVAVRQDGSIIVADSGNHRIRAVSTTGVVTTVAGTGEHGFQDGTCAAALFHTPASVAVCRDGRILVCGETVGYGGRTLRMIEHDGSVRTLAGSGRYGHADGVGTSATFGDFGHVATVENPAI